MTHTHVFKGEPSRNVILKTKQANVNTEGSWSLECSTGGYSAAQPLSHPWPRPTHSPGPPLRRVIGSFSTQGRSMHTPLLAQRAVLCSLETSRVANMGIFGG